MNPKEMVVSIVTAMMVMVIFASTAAAIVVDGDGSDWVGLTNVECIDDDTGEIGTDQTPYFVNGYDIARFCVHYDSSSDTLYFKINVAADGVPGDTDGDDDPNVSSGTIIDHHEVGYGETYAARLDVDGDGYMDYDLRYYNNGVTMYDCTSGDVVSGTADGSIGSDPYSDTVVEISFSPAHDILGFGDCNTEFMARGWAGNEYDKLGEDNTSAFLVNTAPIPVPVGENVCYCTNTSFDGSGSYDPDGTIVLYEWDFDDDGTTDATGVTASHHFDVGGHTVTLTVTDDYGFKCSSTAPTTAWVYENPIADFTATEVDFGTPTEFTDTTTGGSPPYTHRWDFDDDGTYELEGNHPNPTYTYPAPGDYTACLNITDYRGCTDELCKPVHVKNLPPVAEFDFAGTVCKEGMLNASDSYDLDGYITAYEWDLDDDGAYDDATGDTCTFGPVPVPPDDYWLGLKVTDDAGASNTTRKQISLTGDPNAVAKADGSDGPIQIPGAGKMVTFCGNESNHPYSADGAYIVSYDWTILGAHYSTTNPDECFDVFINETTMARLTVVDNYGCTDTDTVSLRKPTPPAQDVPVLTPAGMLALIGMLCIVGAGRILTKGRRL